MKKVKYLCFDMDGTIADLYGVEDWLSMLRAENPLPYEIAKPMWDMERLNGVLAAARKKGIKVVIITWLSLNSSEEYKTAVRQAKRKWLEENEFTFDSFHAVQYGATKGNSIRRVIKSNESAILFDDNEKIRYGWNFGDTVDPMETDIIEFIEGLIGR
jgi:hypothetical protein